MISSKLSEIQAAALKAGLEIIDYRPNRRTDIQWSRRSLAGVSGVVLHQTGGGDSVSALARYHQGRSNHMSIGLPLMHPYKNGLPGIAYTFFVNGRGEVYLCNDLEDKVFSQGDIHTPGDENALFLSVCFGGQFRPWPGSRKDPSPEQMQRARDLWSVLAKVFRLSELDLYGHSDFGKPACPGYALQSFIESTNDAFDWTAQRFDLRTVYGQQQALAVLGFDPGKNDGVWGARTRLAMQRFQLGQDIPVTSSWTRLTTSRVVRAI